MCGASFHTAETDAKNPIDFYNSIVIARELTKLLCLLQRSRGIRKMKGEKNYQLQEDPFAGVTCSSSLPRADCGSGQERRGCVTEPSSARSILLTHPRPQLWPLHLRREAAGAGVSHGPHDRGIPRWLLAAAGWAVSTARALQKEPFSAEYFIPISHLPSK